MDIVFTTQHLIIGCLPYFFLSFVLLCNALYHKAHFKLMQNEEQHKIHPVVFFSILLALMIYCNLCRGVMCVHNARLVDAISQERKKLGVISYFVCKATTVSAKNLCSVEVKVYLRSALVKLYKPCKHNN